MPGKRKPDVLLHNFSRRDCTVVQSIRTPYDRATVQVWDPSGEDHSSQDLAADKRAAIERRLREEDEEQDDAITK